MPESTRPLTADTTPACLPPISPTASGTPCPFTLKSVGRRKFLSALNQTIEAGRDCPGGGHPQRADPSGPALVGGLSGRTRPSALRRSLLPSCVSLVVLFAALPAVERLFAFQTPVELRLVLLAAACVISAAVGLALAGRKPHARTAETCFEQLMAASPDAILMISKAGLVVHENPQARRLFGFGHEEFSGVPADRLIQMAAEENPTDAPLDATLSGGLRSRKPDYLGRRKDGSTFTAEVGFCPLQTDDGLFVLTIIRDVSAQRNSERRRAARHSARLCLAEARDLHGAGVGLLGAVCHNLGWDAGVVWLVPPDAAPLAAACTFPAPPSARAETRPPTPAGWVQQAYHTGEPVWVADTPPLLVGSQEVRSVVVVPITAGPEVVGVLQLGSRTPRDQDDALLETAGNIGSQLGHFIRRQRDEEAVRQAEGRKAAVLEATVTALAESIELRDDYTGGHTQRVTAYAQLLADELGLAPAERYFLKLGTLLHDIGKIGIPDSVLCKPGRLTEAEYEFMKTHARLGASIIGRIPELSPLLSIIRNHHERWDGKGYPDRLAGEDISLLARIVTVADSFDAMTSHRPYRPAMPLDAAFRELQAQVGTQFDPECVQAFLRLRPQIEELFARSGGHGSPAGHDEAPAPASGEAAPRAR
jgi:PAS domain S-box-containing protein/putative nucleotidyltransferase with HDIG domain